MDLEAIASRVVDCGYDVHRGLGPGLLESVYEVVLAKTLEKRGFRLARQKPISFVFDGIEFEDAFRTDVLVEDTLLIEVKSAERSAPIHGKQLLTYLRLMKLPLGFVMNFGAPTFKEGVQRIANNYWQAAR